MKVMTSDEGQTVADHTPLHDKIRQVLTEARVMIPGNQALLGFQFAIILQTGFRELAPWLKWVHLASLSLIALSMVSLLTPVAYHRIVEQGEEANIVIASPTSWFFVPYRLWPSVSVPTLSSWLINLPKCEVRRLLVQG